MRMKRVFEKQRWLRRGIVLASIVVPVAVIAKTSLTSRYPYDPACPWGRLSNGKGMIHRCLTEDEAAGIARDGEGPKPASEKTPSKGDVEEPKSTEPVATLPQDVNLTIGPIEASEGDITVGRLDKPIDRYKKCIVENGGLEAKQGVVVVKFLVRAEAERAEGAGVDSFKGVSKKAAKCVADVVDRRQVGSPTAAVTGAKLHFTFTY